MADDNLYSLPVGMIYLFNLLLGTGVLTMPAVFDQSGYITGIICITILCLISYVQTTFLIESMANANFVKRMQQINISTQPMTSNRSFLKRRYKGESTEMSALLDDEYNEGEEEKAFDNNHSDGSTIIRRNSMIYPSSTLNDIKNDIYTNDDDDDNDSYYSAFNLEPDQRILYLSNSDIGINVIDEANKTDGLGQFNDGFVEDTPKMTVSQSIPQQQQRNLNFDEDSMHSFLRNINHIDKKFQIIDKFELGNMTEMFLNKILSKLFFVSIISYLFGDLLIYNSMMAKSLRELSCTSTAYCNNTANTTNDYLDSICWDSSSISRRNAYRIYLLGFISILGPLTYAKIQKTKFIQIMTIVLRWMAFLSMIGITIYIFATNKAKGRPKAMDIKNIPKLFGICVYSFMCHHSVPSIMTPVKNKSKLYLAITLDYMLVLSFYFIISMTAIFAFDNIEQIYTLNFQVDKCSISNSSNNPANIVGFDIFLPTFPIFTLFSSYTIIALTLINNMKVLAGFNTDMQHRRLLQNLLPLIAIIPPLTIALFTEDVSSIVQYVGSYSGTLIQYVFPSLLVYYSRKHVRINCILPYIRQQQRSQHHNNPQRLSSSIENISLNDWENDQFLKNNVNRLYTKLNPFCSKFQSNFWIYFTGIWWILCLFFVTLDHLRDILHLY